MLPAVAKLFKQRHRQLVTDLALMKGPQPLSSTKEDVARKKQKKEEFVQDLLIFISCAVVGVAVLSVYVCCIQAPMKAGKAD